MLFLVILLLLTLTAAGKNEHAIDVNDTLSVSCPEIVYYLPEQEKDYPRLKFKKPVNISWETVGWIAWGAVVLYAIIYLCVGS